MTTAIRRIEMRKVNPAVIARNHRLEEVIYAAVERNDFGPFHELVLGLAKPFDEPGEFSRYAEPPQPTERVCETFCGT